MRHHGRAQNSNRDVKHVAIGHDFGFRKKSGKDRGHFRFCENDFEQKTTANGQDQDNDERFDVTEPFVLQIKDGEHVQRGNAYTEDERDFEQKVERDGRSDHFGQVAGANRQLANHPKTK